ncbi:MAG: acyltransferase, partial [Burkholderiaceae bacterium]
MTLRARIFGLFPALWVIAVVASVVWWVLSPAWTRALLLIAIVYVLPVACFRLHQLVWPLSEGKSFLNAPGYAPWWGAHQFQVMYTALPALEAVLRLIPGVFSAWLRLWGSRVGSGVYWTPRVEITDRSLIEIGNNVIVGHRAAFYPHVVQKRGDWLVLYVRRISIGDGALIGAGSRLGPGASIDTGVV